MKRLNRILCAVILLLTYGIATANEEQYLFDIKLYDITNVSDGVANHQKLKAYSNPKLIVQLGKPAFMKVGSDNTDEVGFELKMMVKEEERFDLVYKLFKKEEVVSGPIQTTDFSIKKTWLMVTNFDGKKILISVDAEKLMEEI